MWFCQLHQACEGATLRGSRVISAEDILFLMRRDKVQDPTQKCGAAPPSLSFFGFSCSEKNGSIAEISSVSRLQVQAAEKFRRRRIAARCRYAETSWYKQHLRTKPPCMCVLGWSSGPAAVGSNQRRQRLAHDFLAWMDQTGELLSLAERQETDPVKQERMEVRGHMLQVSGMAYRLSSSNCGVVPSASGASDSEHGPGSVHRFL